MSTDKFTVAFTTDQRASLAIVCNHVEGRFIIEPDDLANAVANLTALWNEMHSAPRLER
jgi:hypothetical protein